LLWEIPLQDSGGGREIAVIHTDFPEKFGIPRQSGLVGGLQGTIVFSPEYRNADALYEKLFTIFFEKSG